VANTVDRETRGRMMSRIRGRNTGPELTVRRFLHRQGIRYRLHVRDLAGTPDIVLPGRRAVVFVNGCFWHRHAECRYAYVPKSRSEFWSAKFAATTERDTFATGQLEATGWRVLTVWECELDEPHLKDLVARLHEVRASGTSG
jgi:DNA mismatch endonuclease (patch repair protein)